MTRPLAILLTRHDLLRRCLPSRVEELKKELPESQRSKFSSRFGWSAPFVWLEMPDGSRDVIGGRDDFAAWARLQFMESTAIARVTLPKEPPMKGAFTVNMSKPGNAGAGT